MLRTDSGHKILNQNMVAISASIPTHGYEIPPTPDVTSENSSNSSEAKPDKSKLVVLTRVTHFLPSHILNILLTQEYTVRGVVNYGEDDNTAEVDALFSTHPLARKYLYIQKASPLELRDWERAFASANYVIHMVMPQKAKKTSWPNENEFISHAVEVTKNVLRGCVRAKTVQRLILITSVASIAWSLQKAARGHVYSEDNWEDENNLTVLAKCQLACEKAAWNFINCLPESEKLEFVVINPAFVIGPMIQGKFTETMGVIKALMESTFSTLPSCNIPLIDVRDVARAVAVALVKHEAVGHRHILFCANVQLEEVATILDKEFTKQGFKVMPIDKIEEPEGGCFMCSKRNMPKELLILQDLISKPILYDNTRMQQVLGVEPHFPEETILETAYSLIFWNMVWRQKPARRRKSLSCAKSNNENYE